MKFLIMLIILVGCEVSEETSQFKKQDKASIIKYTEDPVDQNNFGGSGAPIDWNLDSNVLLFQDNYEDSSFNKGGDVSKYGLYNPDTLMAFSDPNDGNKLKFLITEWSNARVLIWNKVPESNNDYPDVVVGQSDFDSSGVNNGGISASTLNNLNSATVCSTGELVVADRQNHRVLIYNKVPTTNGAAADIVIGQADFTSNSANQGGTPAANTVSGPQGVSCYDGKLFIVDSNNRRILVFNNLPSSNNASADSVIGQDDFTTNTSGCSATKFNSPHSVSFYNGQMFLVDQMNHRILIYDNIPTGTTPASYVIGQDNFTSCGSNRGAGVSTPSQGSLYVPQSISINKNGLLAIADRRNNRVLFYTLPYEQGDVAAGIIGQDSYDSNAVATPGENNFEWPIGLIFHGDKVWVIDQQRHRLLTSDVPNDL